MIQRLKPVTPFYASWSGPLCTRQGIEVCLRMRDGRGEFPLAGYIGEGLTLCCWTIDGRYLADGHISPADLFCAKVIATQPTLTLEPRQIFVLEYKLPGQRERFLDPRYFETHEMAYAAGKRNPVCSFRVVRFLEAPAEALEPPAAVKNRLTVV